MFDDLKCNYPLPVEGANSLSYQTKDTPCQSLDQYEIREDGTLWHEDYDVEDKSEAGEWMRQNPGKELPKSFGFSAFAGCLSCVNKRWSQVPFTGEIRFYSMYGVTDGNVTSFVNGWLEWSAYFLANIP